MLGTLQNRWMLAWPTEYLADQENVVPTTTDHTEWRTRGSGSQLPGKQEAGEWWQIDDDDQMMMVMVMLVVMVVMGKKKKKKMVMVCS